VYSDAHSKQLVIVMEIRCALCELGTGFKPRKLVKTRRASRLSAFGVSSQ
jgi:hypothetical protein